MHIVGTYGSVGNHAAKQINQIIPVVAGRPADDIAGVFDRYDIRGDIVDALVHLWQQAAKSSGRYSVDVRSLLFRSYWQGKVESAVTPWRITETPISEREPEPVDDLDWLISNIAELRHQYAGQWIAIAQGQIVASASTVPELEGAIETRGIERPLVTFISEQEPVWNMAYGSEGI